MSFIGNIGYVLVGFVIIISAFLILLAVIERKLHIKIIQTRYTPNQVYIIKVSKLNVKKPQESLKALDKLAKEFLREAFHIKGTPDYSELAQVFTKKNNKKLIEFCTEMNKFLYSRQEITKKDVQNLIMILAEIIASNRILTKENQVELNKISMEKNPQRPSKVKKLESKIPFLKKKK